MCGEPRQIERKTTRWQEVRNVPRHAAHWVPDHSRETDFVSVRRHFAGHLCAPAKLDGAQIRMPICRYQVDIKAGGLPGKTGVLPGTW